MDFHFSVRAEQIARANGAVFVTLVTHIPVAIALSSRWAHRLSHTLMTMGLFSIVWAPNTAHTPAQATRLFQEFWVRNAVTASPPFRKTTAYVMWGLEIVGTWFGQVDRAMGRVMDKILPEKL